MRTDWLKKYPFSTFLIPVFVFLHGINYAYDWVKINDVILFFGYIILATIGLFLLSFILFKDTIKASFFTSFLLLIFFYFGYIQDMISVASAVFFQLKYYIPFLVLIAVITFYFIRKIRREQLSKPFYFFNILFCIYVCVEIVFLTFTIFSVRQEPLKFYADESINFTEKISPKSKPDIYFLVFDEYASSLSLKQNFGFDNSDLDTFLLNKGFFIATHSMSNYATTPFSISSTLNINYFKNLHRTKYPEDFPAAEKSMYTNKLFSFLKDEGYSIHNFSVFDFEDAPSHQKSFGSDLSIKVITHKSMLHALEVVYEQINKDYPKKQLEKTLHDFSTTINNKTIQPKFIYLHLLLPHNPYVFNADGSLRSASQYNKKADAYSIKSYLNQLQFSTTIVKQVVNIVLSSPQNKLIILEGDHGYRLVPIGVDSTFYKNYVSTKEHFKNLNAYYFYDKNYVSLSDSISPVNSFRVVLNTYFKKDILLLKNSDNKNKY